ncbi:hypothetical protein ACFSZS_04655 [Seohaeicola zhoushanensis]
MLTTKLAESRAAIAGQFDMETEGVSMDGLPFDTFVSTLTLSRQRIEIGVITARTWAFWRKNRIDMARTLDALRQIAAAELRPAVQKILKAFNEAQTERAIAGQNRLQVILRMVEGAIEERAQRLRADSARLRQIGSKPEELRKMVHRLHGQLDLLERRIQHLAISDSHLSKATLARAA